MNRKLIQQFMLDRVMVRAEIKRQIPCKQLMVSRKMHQQQQQQ